MADGNAPSGLGSPFFTARLYDPSEPEGVMSLALYLRVEGSRGIGAITLDGEVVVDSVPLEGTGDAAIDAFADRMFSLIEELGLVEVTEEETTAEIAASANDENSGVTVDQDAMSAAATALAATAAAPEAPARRIGQQGTKLDHEQITFRIAGADTGMLDPGDAAGHAKGAQQYYTSIPIARAVAYVLRGGSHEEEGNRLALGDVLDPTAGDGELLRFADRDKRFGIEMDLRQIQSSRAAPNLAGMIPRGAKFETLAEYMQHLGVQVTPGGYVPTTEYHAAHALFDRALSLLETNQTRFDTLFMNPPFGLLWRDHADPIGKRWNSAIFCGRVAKRLLHPTGKGVLIMGARRAEKDLGDMIAGGLRPVCAMRGDDWFRTDAGVSSGIDTIAIFFRVAQPAGASDPEETLPVAFGEWKPGGESMAAMFLRGLIPVATVTRASIDEKGAGAFSSPTVLGELARCFRVASYKRRIVEQHRGRSHGSLDVPYPTTGTPVDSLRVRVHRSEDTAEEREALKTALLEEYQETHNSGEVEHFKSAGGLDAAVAEKFTMLPSKGVWASFAKEAMRRLEILVGSAKASARIEGERIRFDLRETERTALLAAKMRDTLKMLERHDNANIARLIVNSRDWTAIRKIVLPPDGRESMISVQPRFVELVQEALLEIQRDLVPIYPVAPIQRLGYAMVSIDRRVACTSDDPFPGVSAMMYRATFEALEGKLRVGQSLFDMDASVVKILRHESDEDLQWAYDLTRRGPEGVTEADVQCRLPNVPEHAYMQWGGDYIENVPCPEFKFESARKKYKVNTKIGDREYGEVDSGASAENAARLGQILPLARAIMSRFLRIRLEDPKAARIYVDGIHARRTLGSSKSADDRLTAWDGLIMRLENHACDVAEAMLDSAKLEALRSGAMYSIEAHTDKAKEFVGRQYKTTTNDKGETKVETFLKTESWDALHIEFVPADGGAPVSVQDAQWSTVWVLDRFNVPDPGDISTRRPEEYRHARIAAANTCRRWNTVAQATLADWSGRGVKVRAAVGFGANGAPKTRTFSFNDVVRDGSYFDVAPKGLRLDTDDPMGAGYSFQAEDLARMVVKGGGVLAWATGMGKTFGGTTFAAAAPTYRPLLKHGSKTKLGKRGRQVALFVAPQDLVPQWIAETFGRFSRDENDQWIFRRGFYFPVYPYRLEYGAGRHDEPRRVVEMVKGRVVTVQGRYPDGFGFAELVATIPAESREALVPTWLRAERRTMVSLARGARAVATRMRAKGGDKGADAKGVAKFATLWNEWIKGRDTTRFEASLNDELGRKSPVFSGAAVAALIDRYVVAAGDPELFGIPLNHTLRVAGSLSEFCRLRTFTEADLTQIATTFATLYGKDTLFRNALLAAREVIGPVLADQRVRDLAVQIQALREGSAVETDDEEEDEEKSASERIAALEKELADAKKNRDAYAQRKGLELLNGFLNAKEPTASLYNPWGEVEVRSDEGILRKPLSARKRISREDKAGRVTTAALYGVTIPTHEHLPVSGHATLRVPFRPARGEFVAGKVTSVDREWPRWFVAHYEAMGGSGTAGEDLFIAYTSSLMKVGMGIANLAASCAVRAIRMTTGGVMRGADEVYRRMGDAPLAATALAKASEAEREYRKLGVRLYLEASPVLLGCVAAKAQTDLTEHTQKLASVMRAPLAMALHARSKRGASKVVAPGLWHLIPAGLPGESSADLFSAVRREFNAAFRNGRFDEKTATSTYGSVASSMLAVIDGILVAVMAIVERVPATRTGPGKQTVCAYDDGQACPHCGADYTAGYIASGAVKAIADARIVQTDKGTELQAKDESEEEEGAETEARASEKSGAGKVTKSLQRLRCAGFHTWSYVPRVPCRAAEIARTNTGRIVWTDGFLGRRVRTMDADYRTNLRREAFRKHSEEAATLASEKKDAPSAKAAVRAREAVLSLFADTDLSRHPAVARLRALGFDQTVTHGKAEVLAAVDALCAALLAGHEGARATYGDDARRFGRDLMAPTEPARGTSAARVALDAFETVMVEPYVVRVALDNGTTLRAVKPLTIHGRPLPPGPRDVGKGKTLASGRFPASAIAITAPGCLDEPVLKVEPDMHPSDYNRAIVRRANTEENETVRAWLRRATVPGFKGCSFGLAVASRAFGAAHYLTTAFKGGSLIVDEAHKAGSNVAAYAEAIRGIRARNKLLMTGTPVRNLVRDVFWLFWKTAGGNSARFPYPYGAFSEFTEEFHKRAGSEASNEALEQMKKLQLAVEEAKTKGEAQVLKDARAALLEFMRENKKLLAGAKTFNPELVNLTGLWRMMTSNLITRSMDSPDLGVATPKVTFIRPTVPFGTRQASLYRSTQDLRTFVPFYFGVVAPRLGAAADERGEQRGKALEGKEVERKAAILGAYQLMAFASTFPRSERLAAAAAEGAADVDFTRTMAASGDEDGGSEPDMDRFPGVPDWVQRTSTAYGDADNQDAGVGFWPRLAHRSNWTPKNLLTLLLARKHAGVERLTLDGSPVGIVAVSDAPPPAGTDPKEAAQWVRLQVSEGHAPQWGKMGENVLILSDVREFGEWAANALESSGCTVFRVVSDGSTIPPKKRAGKVRAFKLARGSVMTAGIKALGTGHDLTTASVVIVNGLPWSPAEFWQGIGRVRRLTSPRPVTAYIMNTLGSMDDLRWTKLRRKQDASDLAIKGKIPPFVYREGTAEDQMEALVSDASQGADTTIDTSVWQTVEERLRDGMRVHTCMIKCAGPSGITNYSFADLVVDERACYEAFRDIAASQGYTSVVQPAELATSESPRLKGVLSIPKPKGSNA